MNMVAEGVKTTKSTYDLAAKEEVEMPITEQTYNLLYRETSAADAVFALMTRSLKHERVGIDQTE
jgi:glycerol-3-phosphate dehydrogenase (NAD(P)+)